MNLPPSDLDAHAPMPPLPAGLRHDDHPGDHPGGRHEDRRAPSVHAVDPSPEAPQALPEHEAPVPRAARVHWGAEDLWLALEPRLPGLSIEIVERLDSTNSELTERLRRASRVAGDRRGSRGDDLSPQLLVAIDQTAGRGRLGRRWHATPGASLTFSLALPLARADWSGLSLAVGLAVVEALDPAGERLGLKWPNDLILRDPPPAGAAAEDAAPGRKLGGILIESVSVGDRRAAVIGIGLNIGTQRVVEAEYGAASLVEIAPEATPQTTLARIAGPLVEVLRAFDESGFAPLAGRFAARDVLRGRLVRTSDAGMPEGVALGVDVDGALRLEAGARTHRVLSGEVSIRPAAAR